MAYKAAKRMTLNGTKVKPGDMLDEELLASMPLGKIDSLRRVNYIVEVIDAPEPKSKSQKRRMNVQRKAKTEALETEEVEEATPADPASEGDKPSEAVEVEVSSDPVEST